MKVGQIWSSKTFEGKPWGWKVEVVTKTPDGSQNAAIVRSIKTQRAYVWSWPLELDAPTGLTLIEDVP